MANLAGWLACLAKYVRIFKSSDSKMLRFGNLRWLHVAALADWLASRGDITNLHICKFQHVQIYRFWVAGLADWLACMTKCGNL